MQVSGSPKSGSGAHGLHTQAKTTSRLQELVPHEVPLCVFFSSQVHCGLDIWALGVTCHKDSTCAFTILQGGTIDTWKIFTVGLVRMTEYWLSF